jgi:hypothetical protein
MTTWAFAAAGWLAKAPPASQVKPGWLGLAVVAGIGILTYLLWRSMNRQLTKVHFDDPTSAGQQPAPGPEASWGDRPDVGEDGGAPGEPGDEPREART